MAKMSFRMLNFKKKWFSALVLLGLGGGMMAQNNAAMYNPNAFRGLRETRPELLNSEEGRRVGDLVLTYQRITGGWPKNTDMVSALSQQQLRTVLRDKQREDDSTIDNGATTSQMVYLAHLYRSTREARYAEAFRKGLEYLLSGQYESGGWPQFWPVTRGYQYNITFNDDAMVNTLRMFRDVFEQKEPYDGDLTDEALRARLRASFDKGIECILRTQILVKGQPTVWCQQYDRETFEPAKARAYELPSFCSAESAGIVRLLMELPDPDARVKKAIHGAMKWYDTYKLSGLRYDRSPLNGERAARLVESSESGPLWARFYDLKYIEPYVCDRDGLPRRHLEQLGRERRNGYSWYNSRPAELYPLYEEWADRYDRKHKLKLDLKSPGANTRPGYEIYRQPEFNLKAFDRIVKPGQSIQEAVNAAPVDGKEPFKILVLSGLYHQQVHIDRPNIVLVGENREQTVIELSNEDADANGRIPAGGTVITLGRNGDDCIISGFTLRNNHSIEGVPVEETWQVPHRFTVKGEATRTILINCTILSDGNDALALWAKGDQGMYYHADLDIRCQGVDFICPRGWCFATRCHFYGGGRAMLWHDGRGDISQKFVIHDSDFDASVPTLLGRYHHDAQFFLISCRLSQNVLNRNIQYAYSDHVLDPCPWGERIYYSSCFRDGGHSGWLNNNLQEANAGQSYSLTAQWTFGGKWDPEQRIRDLWEGILNY